MQALGRVPNVDNLNLDLAEVKLDKSSSIIVDKFFRTSAKDIYAIGDVINRVQLTPVAIAEAMNLVNNFFRKKKIVFNYKNIPTAVFANPNYAYIGLTEEEAKKRFDKVDVFMSKFRPLKYSLSDINEKVFIKLLVNRSNDKVLGLHYLGENAAEIIQGFAVAIVKGLKKEDFDKTIGIHPSSAEEIVTMKNKT
jgi:glutathione reductase (NADPH)